MYDSASPQLGGSFSNLGLAGTSRVDVLLGRACKTDGFDSETSQQ